MTTEELRALIAKCEETQDTGHWAQLWMAITPSLLAEIAADALRFQYIAREYDQIAYRLRVDDAMTSEQNPR